MKPDIMLRHVDCSAEGIARMAALPSDKRFSMLRKGAR
jgi:hypothetical protein